MRDARAKRSAVNRTETGFHVHVHKHTPFDCEIWGPQQTMVRQKAVYTDNAGGKRKAPNWRGALEQGSLWSWHVVVVTWSCIGGGAEGGCVGGGATADQR